jgi:hypothetical protein
VKPLITHIVPGAGTVTLPIERSQPCGKRGPKSGEPCSRFAGHEVAPSPVLGPDWHEARGKGAGNSFAAVLERWEVTPEEITRNPGAASRRYEESLRDDTTSEQRAQLLAAVEREADPGPVPEPTSADKAEELDEVKKILAAAGLMPRDTFQRAGAPGSGLWYAELNNAEPLMLRVQILFGRPVSWSLMSTLAMDLESLREALR